MKKSECNVLTRIAGQACVSVCDGWILCRKSDGTNVCNNWGDRGSVLDS